MSIVLISPQIYPCEIGGVEIFNYHLMKELSNYYELFIFTNCRKKKIKIDHLFYINLINFKFVGCNFFNSLSILYNIMKIRKNIDLILFPYTSNSYLAYPGLIIHKILKIPYIISIHGGGIYKWEPEYFQKQFFKNATDIIAVSKPIKIEYEQRINKKIKIIPPLIPFTVSKYSKEELKNKYGFERDDKLIISVGSIKHIKGSDFLLKGFMNLGKEYIDNYKLKLIYVGDGEMKSDLEITVKKRNLNKYIKFFGKIPHETIPEIYRIANIYVLPSIFEGTPISLLEAMFNKLPIIGANVKGIKNIITHNKNGLLFESLNTNDLNAKIKELVENESLANKLGISAKKDYDENYQFERTVKDYDSIFREYKE